VSNINFSPLAHSAVRAEDTGAEISYLQDVWRRFRQNKLAMASVFAILLILLASFLGPSLTGKSYDAQQLNLRNMPPRIEILTAADGTRFYVHPELRVFLVDESGLVGEALEPAKKQLAKKGKA
jgi:oligopeptide transport system permease protein